jgi:quercetin dioxygenase-like cupin family protein
MIFTATHGTWGERIRTFSWDGGISTILFLEPNRRCSWHKHIAAYNRFFVISGCLGVKTDKGYTTKLGPRQMFEVEPGVVHEFQTYDEQTIIEEIAYVRYDINDIHRERLGGPLDGRNDEA